MSPTAEQLEFLAYPACVQSTPAAYNDAAQRFLTINSHIDSCIEPSAVLQLESSRVHCIQQKDYAWCLQVREQVTDALARSQSAVGGIKINLAHSSTAMQESLQLLLVALRLSARVCEESVLVNIAQVCSCEVEAAQSTPCVATYVKASVDHL